MGSWVRGGGQASFTRMSWTWTGYDYDPVFRYKDEATFFQTGRNNAEARFWQTKIHEGDRRGTKSQIEIGSDGDSVKDHADVTKESSEDSASKDDEAEYEEEDDVRSLGDRDYQYGYGGGRDPGQRYFVYEETRHDGHKGRDRTMSIVSTISRKDDWRSPSKDYQYSYGEDAVEVERPPARGSVERQRGSVERQRVSVERKLKKQSEERPRQSEERSWQSVERPRQSEERPRQSNERPRQSEESSRQTDAALTQKRQNLPPGSPMVTHHMTISCHFDRKDKIPYQGHPVSPLTKLDIVLTRTFLTRRRASPHDNQMTHMTHMTVSSYW